MDTLNTPQEPAQSKKKENPWKKNIVDDPAAPLLYSPQVVFVFSVVFTVIFGAVLLSMNLKDRTARFIVIVYGVVYSVVAGIVLYNLPISNTGITIAVNGVGALLLVPYFWDKYVGADTKFRTRSFWPPLIISFILVALIICAFFSFLFAVNGGFPL